MTVVFGIASQNVKEPENPSGSSELLTRETEGLARSQLATKLEEALPLGSASTQCETGGDLLSQGRSSQVPSAQLDLTSVFGMGTGVTPALSLPRLLHQPTTLIARPENRPSQYMYSIVNPPDCVSQNNQTI